MNADRAPVRGAADSDVKSALLARVGAPAAQAEAHRCCAA
jgi:hypothetical protein